MPVVTMRGEVNVVGPMVENVKNYDSGTDCYCIIEWIDVGVLWASGLDYQNLSEIYALSRSDRVGKRDGDERRLEGGSRVPSVRWCRRIQDQKP